MTRGTKIGFVRAMTNLFWTGNLKVLNVGEFAVCCRSESGDGGDILCFDVLPICALAKRNSGTRKIAGDVIIDFCNLPVLPVLHRNSSTS